MYAGLYQEEVKTWSIHTAGATGEVLQQARVLVAGHAVSVLPAVTGVTLHHHTLVLVLVAWAPDHVFLLGSLRKDRSGEAGNLILAKCLLQRFFLVHAQLQVPVPQDLHLSPYLTVAAVEPQVILEEEKDVLIYVSHAVV